MVISMFIVFMQCHKIVTQAMPEQTFQRAVDTFCRDVSHDNPRNINVEMRERDGFRCFPHGVTSYVLNEKRIDGGWHVSIARHLRIFLCTTTLLRNKTKRLYAKAYHLLFTVHVALRMPLPKTQLGMYQANVNELVEQIKMIARECTQVGAGCNIMKLHLPYHWADTRLQLGCSAAEKTLERKLGQAQKKYFPLTNGKHGAQVLVKTAPIMYICEIEYLFRPFRMIIHHVHLL
jgi:hypothetical protein